MALTARSVSVGNSSPALLTTGAGGRGPQGVSDFSAAVYNLGTGSVYVGGSNVSVANGFPLIEGAAMSLGEMGADDAVYAISASGTVDVRVVELG